MFCDNDPLKVLVRLYGLGGGLSGTPTGDEGTVPITCLKMPSRVEEQGRSLFSPYLATSLSEVCKFDGVDKLYSKDICSNNICSFMTRTF